MIKDKKTFKAQTTGGGREETKAMAVAITPSISSNMHNTVNEKQLYLREPVMKKADEQ